MSAEFSAAVQGWFAANFPEPTAVQRLGWPAIAAGEHTLICAPTGSGKTLTAFLWSIDRLVNASIPDDKFRRTRVLYLSPLRSLAFDVEKNLRAPIAGIGHAAERLGVSFTAPSVALRTGDTSTRDRAALIRRPVDILITTPESLYLMLTSSARETLRGINTVIVDEIHALAPTKRGAHLALSLERLEVLCDRPPQRIGLSATQRPLEEVARFLGGFHSADEPRLVTIVDAGIRKPLELTVTVPIEDMADLGSVADTPRSGPTTAGPAGKSIWPSIHPCILDDVMAHRSTIIFANARRQAERLAARLNELAQATGVVDEGVELVKAHHGSLAREQRVIIEDQLKRGELRAIVATSSLELGIDMGAVDLVVQVESPGAVSRGLQRIGRAGHSVGEASKGTIYPKHRGDLVEVAVVVEAMQEGRIEATRYQRNPLDVLAQHVVATVAMEQWSQEELLGLVRRCACFATLSDDLWSAVLDLLAGRYPSEEFSELRPRIVWDRLEGNIRAREGAKRLAVTNGGTIPDRGLFGVFLPDGARVGELDEEMVYESRPGETFLLGATTWRIEDITFDRVLVSPAPGLPGKMPFWHGDRPGRPVELGMAIGAFIREVSVSPNAIERLRNRTKLDEFAAQNLLAYFNEQREATGVIPDDRTIVVERFRDELGDWRLCVLTPFGSPVHAPWAMAIEARMMDRVGVPIETMWTDDGIVIRLPEAVDELAIDDISLDPATIDDVVMAALPSTSLFSARFRECSARALLLPRRRPDRRTPLWQQRQRAADLLAVAAKYPSFPMLLEAGRECIQDVFDVAALRSILHQLRTRQIRIVQVDTPKASPFSKSLLFNWIASYMYEGDAPLAERRAAALALDRDLLHDLLGAEELRELLDADVIADFELELQRLSDGRRARSADEVDDVLRVLGPLSIDELGLRCEVDPTAWADELVRARRVIALRLGGSEVLATAQDAGRLRDGLGVALPLGLPADFVASVDAPLDELVARYARTHGPFSSHAVAQRLGASPTRVERSLGVLEQSGRVVRGAFRPGGAGQEWCDAEVLRVLRRRCLARLRQEVEPVDPSALARFLPAWQGVRADGNGQHRGVDALVESIGVLQGASLVASTIDAEVFASRVGGYRAADLDALCTSGELVWVGAGALSGSDGRIKLFFRDQLPLLAPSPKQPPLRGSSERSPADAGPVHAAIRSHLLQRGASFWAQLMAAAPGANEAELLAALWDLAWAGEVTNDSLAPVRAFVAAKMRKSTGSRGPSRPRPGRLTRLGPPSGAGRWSLVSELLEPCPTPTQIALAQAQQLLERHGVLTREAVLAEGLEGGFSAVYPVLKVLEERGQVRRGYFVAGLGAAQFALVGAVDRLRMFRHGDHDITMLLASTDPAQPYGAALPWPITAGRPTRTAGTYVVSVAGTPLVWLDRVGRHLVTFADALTDDRWVPRVVSEVKDGRLGTVEIRKVNGAPVHDSQVVAPLRGAGFADGYKGLILRG